MEQLTDREKEALTELLPLNLTPLQHQALGKVLQAKLLIHDEMEVKLASAALGVVRSVKALDEIDAKLAVAWCELTPEQRKQLKGTEVEAKALEAMRNVRWVPQTPNIDLATAPRQPISDQRVSIPECDCGNIADPNHPKRGKCKASLGGVKL